MILVVCHDAGGAEIVSSYVRQNDGDYRYCLEGPAIRIFERKLGFLDRVSLERGIAGCGHVISGTGWQSKLEWSALGLARETGVRSTAFLDHWVNYEARFVRNGILHLPDEICVGDRYAEQIAARVFSSIPVRLIENPYLLDIRAEMAEFERARPDTAHSILYVCEPIEDYVSWSHEVRFGYNEYDALRFFLSNLQEVMASPARINIRRHPAEPEGKYSWAAREFPDLPIVFSDGHTLGADITAAEMVVGCETMAMVVGLIAGKRVVSSIPPGGKPCSLPHPEIEKLADFASNYQVAIHDRNE